MRVTLVLAPWYRRESPSPDIAMSAAILKKEGHEVSVFDFNNQLFGKNYKTRVFWKHFIVNYDENDVSDFLELTEPFFREYAQYIISENPEIIVFKVIGHTYYNALKLAAIIKEINPGLKIIFSGLLVFDREDLNRFVLHQDEFAFDYAVCGEDEAALPLIINALNKNEKIPITHYGKIIDCIDGPKVEDLDNLPFFDFSYFDLEAYRYKNVIEIFTSKGCPRRCSFCLDWKTESKYRSMSASRIYNEVLHQYSRHDIKHFRFCDKTINGDMAVLKTFTELMLEGKYGGVVKNITWSGDVMVRDELTYELLKKMRNSGCKGLGFGIETGSDKVLKEMRKCFTISQAERVIFDAHSVGIVTAINIMVGFPTETIDDFNKTKSFIEKNKNFIDEIRLSYIGCLVTEYSDLAKFPDQYGLADTDTVNWSSKDGENTYSERERRYKEVVSLIESLGIPLRVNSRFVNTEKKCENESDVLIDIDFAKIKSLTKFEDKMEVIRKLQFAEEFDKAIEICEDVIRDNNANADSLVLKAELLVAKMQYDEALKYLDEALIINSEHTWAMRVKGDIYIEKNEYNAAEDQFNLAIKIENSPNRAWSYLSLGRLYIKKGEKENAVKNIEKALEYFPDNKNIVNELERARRM